MNVQHTPRKFHMEKDRREREKMHERDFNNSNDVGLEGSSTAGPILAHETGTRDGSSPHRYRTIHLMATLKTLKRFMLPISWTWRRGGHRHGAKKKGEARGAQIPGQIAES